MVPRWRAWTSTATALAFGWGSGRYGLGNTIAVLAWTAIAVTVAAGVTLELCRRSSSNDFEHIERRRQQARALEGDR